MDETEKHIEEALKQAEARLGDKVKTGDDEVLKQLRHMQQEALPQLLSAIKEQAGALRGELGGGPSSSEGLGVKVAEALTFPLEEGAERFF